MAQPFVPILDEFGYYADGLSVLARLGRGGSSVFITQRLRDLLAPHAFGGLSPDQVRAQRRHRAAWTLPGEAP